MKRTVTLAVVIFAAFAPALFGPTLFAPAALFAQARTAPAAPSGSGIIKEVVGTVELKRPGQSAFVPAKAGETVAQETVISTGFRSMALISLGGTIITVKPLTMLSLAAISLQAAEERVELRLRAGRVRVDVAPVAGTKTDLTVGSSYATASVRGTSFEFDTQNIYLYEGVVAYRGTAGGIRRVRAGSSSLINDDGKPEDPLVIAISDLAPPAPAGTESGWTEKTAPAADRDLTFTLSWN